MWQIHKDETEPNAKKTRVKKHKKSSSSHKKKSSAKEDALSDDAKFLIDDDEESSQMSELPSETAMNTNDVTMKESVKTEDSVMEETDEMRSERKETIEQQQKTDDISMSPAPSTSTPPPPLVLAPLPSFEKTKSDNYLDIIFSEPKENKSITRIVPDRRPTKISINGETIITRANRNAVIQYLLGEKRLSMYDEEFLNRKLTNYVNSLSDFRQPMVWKFLKAVLTRQV